MKSTVLKTFSFGPWKAVTNQSWSEDHVNKFSNKLGYVICHKNINRELVAVASVIGIPFADQEQIDANAKLIEAAPDLFYALEQFTLLDKGKYREIEGLLQRAQDVICKIRRRPL